ncbi:MAG TPA: hypothetical protein VFT29_00010 [Gemmatimonadaceae bacterium]|nr:hypothetical protein [Gemmatimonadaceae bacterium]
MAEPSTMRRIVGMVFGALFATTAAVYGLSFAAEWLATASSIWAVGLVAIRLGLGPSVLAGVLVGSWGGLRWAKRPRLLPWAERPNGVLFGHYLLAWIAAVPAALIAIVFFLVATDPPLQTLKLFVGQVHPNVQWFARGLTLASILAGMFIVGRSTLISIDRRVHRRRAGNGDKGQGTRATDWGTEKGTG